MNISRCACGLKLWICPVLFVLSIGNVIDVTNSLVTFPHLASNLAVKFGDSICLTAHTKRGECMAEFITLNTADLACFLQAQAIEESELVQ